MDTAKPNNQIEINMDGNVSGQIAVGDHNSQSQTINSAKSEVSQADLYALHQLIESLRLKVVATVEPDQQAKALERVTELEQAITAEKPDLTTMEYVKDWFGRNIPHLAGAVSGLVINPLVGKLVEAAGETITHEFKRHFPAQ